MQEGKNKTTTYLLICAVAIVWGIVLYKIFAKTTEEDYTIKNGTSKVPHEPYDQYMPKKDTVKLSLQYRDPFLGTPAKEEKKAEDNSKVIKPIPAPQNLPPPIDWNIVKYAGRIINPVSKKTVSIITVNGEERMMSEGDVFHGVRLLKNKKDSILISLQGKQKHIKQ